MSSQSVKTPDWSKFKQALNTLLEVASSHQDTNKDGLIDPIYHFLSAIRVVRKAIEENPSDKTTVVYADLFREVVTRLNNPKTLGHIKEGLTVTNWVRICGTLVRALTTPQNRGLYKQFETLLTKTIPNYNERLGAVRETYPNPQKLASCLGLLDWDIPDSWREAAERAEPYYQEIASFLREKSKLTANEKPNLLEEAAKIAEGALVTLGEVKTNDRPTPQLFKGTLLAKRYTARQEAVLHLYDALSEQADDVRWMSWSEWAYKDPYGAIDHRSRALQNASKTTVPFASSFLKANIHLPAISAIHVDDPVEAFKVKGSGLHKNDGLLARLCEIAGEKEETYASHKKELEEFLLDNVCFEGLSVFREVNKDFLKKIIDQSQGKIMESIVLNIYSTLENIYSKISLVDVDHTNYLKVPKLKASDSPLSLLHVIIDNWVQSVNFAKRKRVDSAKAKELFLEDENNREHLLDLILKPLGSYPLLNLYCQGAQGVAQSLSHLWVEGIRHKIMADFGLRAGKPAWCRALETLFIEKVFYPFAVKKYIAFPSELLLEVIHVQEDPFYAVVRGTVVEEKERGLEDVIKGMILELENAIADIQKMTDHTIPFRPSKVILEIPDFLRRTLIPESLRKDFKELKAFLKAYNVAYSRYILRASEVAIQGVYKLIFDTTKEVAEIQKILMDNMERALGTFRVITGSEPIPFLCLTNKKHLDLMISQGILDIRLHGGLPDIGRHGNLLGVSVFVLLCLMKRRESLNNISNETRQRLVQALEEAKRADKVFREHLSGPVAEWWGKVAEKVYNPGSRMPEGWDKVAMENGWTKDSPDLVFIITLRYNLDAALE